MAETDYAIVVGLTKYPELGNLDGPENDAKAFAVWLKQKNGGNVPRNRVKLILSSSYKLANERSLAKPTVDLVRREFEKLIELGQQGNGRVGRRLYLYMAGHGFGKFDDSALLTADAADGPFLSNHIPGRTYANWFCVAAFFEEVVLFMDCCRDHYRSVPIGMAWPELSNPPASNFFYGFATQWSKKSWEKRVQEGEKIEGLFSKALLEGLNGSNSDRGRVTSASLASYVHNRVKELSAPADESLDDPQTPEFGPQQTREIVFADGVPQAVTRVTISLAPIPALAMPVTMEVLDSPIRVIQSGILNAVDESLACDLPVGFYRVRIQGTSRSQPFEVVGQEAFNVTI